MRWGGALIALAACGLAPPAWADARLTVLLDLLRIDDAVRVLQIEGQHYADLLNEDMLDGQGGEFFAVQVRRIYNADAMTEYIRAGFGTTMEEEDVEAAIAFFATDLGARVVSYEIAAREAMMDPDTEEAARTNYAEARAAGDPRLEPLDRFEKETSLLDRNVAAALSGNLAFYNGLVDGDFIDLTPDQRIAEVYAQADGLREDTEGWLYGFLFMAYQALEQEELEVYVAYTTSASGLVFNQALFAGHEKMYRDISYALGRAVALSAAGSAL